MNRRKALRVLEILWKIAWAGCAVSTVLIFCGFRSPFTGIFPGLMLILSIPINIMRVKEEEREEEEKKKTDCER